MGHVGAWHRPICAASHNAASASGCADELEIAPGRRDSVQGGPRELIRKALPMREQAERKGATKCVVYAMRGFHPGAPPPTMKKSPHRRDTSHRIPGTDRARPSQTQPNASEGSRLRSARQGGCDEKSSQARGETLASFRTDYQGAARRSALRSESRPQSKGAAGPGQGRASVAGRLASTAQALRVMQVEPIGYEMVRADAAISWLPDVAED